MVREFVVATRNRTGRTGRGHGKVPGDAHVHNIGVAKDRHESRWPAIGLGPVARKGEKSYGKSVRTYTVGGLNVRQTTGGASLLEHHPLPPFPAHKIHHNTIKSFADVSILSS